MTKCADVLQPGVANIAAVLMARPWPSVMWQMILDTGRFAGPRRYAEDAAARKSAPGYSARKHGRSLSRSWSTD
jgi:hypothetical protein